MGQMAAAMEREKGLQQWRRGTRAAAMEKGRKGLHARAPAKRLVLVADAGQVLGLAGQQLQLLQAGARLRGQVAAARLRRAGMTP